MPTAASCRSRPGRRGCASCGRKASAPPTSAGWSVWLDRHVHAMLPPGGAMAKRIRRKANARRPPPRPRDATRAIETALAGFAHDIRTPLTGIIAIGELLSTSQLDERERRWVAALKEAAEHIVALTTVVVDAARAGQRRLAPRRERFDAL